MAQPPDDHRPFNILLIEPSADEQFFIGEALRHALGDDGQVDFVSSGEQAIAYLRGDGPYADRSRHPFPSLVMTELNMSRGDAFDVLEFMSHNPAWAIVPRIVFSSSDDPADVRTAYAVGAAAYHRKPSRAGDLAGQIQAIVDYWRSCELPQMDPTGKLLLNDPRGILRKRYPPPLGGERMER